MLHGLTFKLAVVTLALIAADALVADTLKVIPMNQKNLATYYIEASMRGSGDVEFMVDTKHLVLGGDCVLRDVEAAVFPEKTRMLLGLSALSKASPFIFSTNPPSLSLSNCSAAVS